MRVAVVHNAVVGTDGPDDQDVLVQAETVCKALAVLDHRSHTIACTLDLDRVRRRIEAFSPDVVFNLVESLDGHGRLIHLFPFVLDAVGIPYTGAPAESILTTTNKVMAKQHMTAAGLPTPEWIGPHPSEAYGSPGLTNDKISETTWIIKSVWEHASVGLDETGIVRAQGREGLLELVRQRASAVGGACFAEQYIDGREFNLSLLTGHSGPEVLPPAEIVFQHYGKDKPRIVDYRAKWDHTSFEFHHTPRRFEFGPKDGALLKAFQELALACWKVFGLRGYGRIDFRIDHDGRPWILEVNANPCLSPDAGFAAALNRAGLSFAEAIGRILEDALGGHFQRDRNPSRKQLVQQDCPTSVR